MPTILGIIPVNQTKIGIIPDLAALGGTTRLPPSVQLPVPPAPRSGRGRVSGSDGFRRATRV